MLIRFDPFRDLDRLSQELWGQATGPAAAPARMPMDAVRRGDQVEISFELPGVDPESIDVEVENNVLTVHAERREESERREGDEVLVRERRFGRYSRQISLGDNLDADRLEARYHDGVLQVTVPVAEQAKPRKVEVARGGSDKAIDASSSAA
jgi:HSP20 family protein